MERRDGAALPRRPRLIGPGAAAGSARGWDPLTRWRRAALGVLWAEHAARALWAPLSVLAAALGLALLGLVPTGIAPPLVFGALTAAGIWATARGARGLAPPAQAEAERRLERDSGLPHQPFAVLADTPVPGTGAEVLWHTHRARALAALRHLRLAPPRPGLPQTDRRALRIGAALLLLAGLVVAGGDAPRRLAAAFLPGFGPPGPAPTLLAWVEPPAYTGLAPIFLPQGGGALTVPAGSRLTLTWSGGRKPYLTLAGASVALRDLGPDSFQATAILSRGGELRLARLLSAIAAWRITLTPNEPPRAEFAGPPAQAGRTLETRFPWHTAQRWGVATLSLAIVPDEHPDLPPITLPVPLPGTPKEATGTLQSDLSAHPYAGVKVTARLTARDVSGQTGESAPVTLTLPQRSFKNGLARAIVELRRRLALRTETAADAAADLDALTPPPAAFDGQSAIFLNAKAVAALLRQSRSIGVLPEAIDRLWIIALALDGALPADSQVALDRAREALRRAITDRAQGKIDNAELQRRLEQLRQALAQRLADMARQAVKDGKLPPFDPRSQQFRAPGLDRMMRQLEQAAREGRTEEAERRLRELENVLRNLPNARILSPEEAARAQAARAERRKQEGAVQDMIQREAGLMDSAQARAPRPAPIQPFRAPSFQQDTPAPDPDRLEAEEEARSADARTQRALRQALRALRQSLGAQAPQSLAQAESAMGEAAEALSAGQEQAARAAQGRAIAALTKGGQQMQQQDQQGAGQLAILPGGASPGGEEESAGDEPGGDPTGARLDPFGRPFRQGAGGRAADDNSVRVPEEMEAGRSRAIQEELRRRGAEKSRPRKELDYIDRLLKGY